MHTSLLCKIPRKFHIIITGKLCRAAGGAGFILLDMSNAPSASRNNRFLMILSGLLSIMVSFHLCQLFIRIKIPGYLISE
jgi:hypothetical protein